MSDDHAAAEQAHARSYYVQTLLALAIGSALAWWSLAQVWIAAVAVGLSASVSQTGGQLYPISLVGAWIGLACVLAILATSGKARRVIAILVALCAIAVLVAPASARIGGSDLSTYWIATTIAGLVMLASAAAIWIFSPSWRSLSARQGGSTKSSDSMWDALDRGEDPTESQNSK